MKRTIQITFSALLFVGLAAVASYVLIGRTTTTPDVSVRNGVVNPAGLFVNAVKSGEFYREQIARHPEVADNYVKLGQLQIQLAKETGDELRYIPEAHRLILEALKRDPANYNARVLEATLLNSLHRFDDARIKLEALIAEQPHHAYLRGAYIDALTELGEYEAAVAQSDSMQSLKPGLTSYARVAYLRELHGQVDGAIQAMQMAASAGATGSSDRSWALYQLGTLHLSSGDAATASAIFNGILEEAPDYTMALDGLARVALAEGDIDEALSLARNGFASTQRTVFLELELEALSAADLPGQEAIVASIESSFRQLEAMGENIDMEYADFLADNDKNLGEALIRIERDAPRRPNHLHTLETHAWVLHKLGRDEEALPIVKNAMRLGKNDAKLYYRAAQIAKALEQWDVAQRWTTQAIDFHLQNESRTAWLEVSNSSKNG